MTFQTTPRYCNVLTHKSQKGPKDIFKNLIIPKKAWKISKSLNKENGKELLKF